MAVVAFTTRASLVGGQPENIADVTDCLDKLLVGVNTVDTAQIAALAVTDAKIAASTVTDAKLASPNNAVWRTIRQQPFILSGGQAAGTYFFIGPGYATANGGTASYSYGVIPIQIPSLTDYTVAGKTAQGRVLVHSLTNATASGVALSFGLYPVAGVAGATNAQLLLTLGVGVVGSFVNLTPSASAGQQAASSAFALPSVTSYLLGVQWATTTLSANSLCMGTIDLQVAFT